MNALSLRIILRLQYLMTMKEMNVQVYNHIIEKLMKLAFVMSGYNS